MLEEARALSGGLRQLGRSLEEQADRILRDVTAAHKRMQADLRIGPGPATAELREPAAPRPRRRPAAPRATEGPRSASAPTPSRRHGAPTRRASGALADPSADNPFEELEVPNWRRRANGLTSA